MYNFNINFEGEFKFATAKINMHKKNLECLCTNINKYLQALSRKLRPEWNKFNTK